MPDESPEIVSACISLRHNLTSKQRETAMKRSITNFRNEHPRAYCTIWGKTYPPRDPKAPRFPPIETTREWKVLNRAMDELVTNGDIQELTTRKHIVGHLMKRLGLTPH